jgi:uncharacterized protein (TIGR03435 family)
MIIEAIFWFYPLVWWIGARLMEERERACDEEVLRMGSEPNVYAESILKTCQFYLESPLTCMSGVTGADLKQRIVRIMTEGVSKELGSWRKALLGAILAATIGGPLAFGIVNGPKHEAQSQSTSAPSFEVASIMQNVSGNNFASVREAQGRFTATNARLKDLIARAYGVRISEISGPDWLTSERFDIAAEAAGPVDDDQLSLMLRTLLADRFGLALHREPKVLPVYELVVAKSGPKLQPVQAAQSRGRTLSSSHRGYLSANGASTEFLAELLSRQTDRPVLDRTGLSGTYNFELKWTPDDLHTNLGQTHDDSGKNNADGPSIFTAVEEQAGLKLKPARAPVEVLVVDQVQKTPTAN